MGRFVGRENVHKRLAALEGEQGRTIYAGGRATIELPDETVLVRPPFGLAYEGRYETVELAPLFAALAADHLVAALLVRLGGYAIGVFDGERIVAARSARASSRADTRKAARRLPASAAAARSKRGR